MYEAVLPGDEQAHGHKRGVVGVGARRFHPHPEAGPCRWSWLLEWCVVAGSTTPCSAGVVEASVTSLRPRSSEETAGSPPALLFEGGLARWGGVVDLIVIVHVVTMERLVVGCNQFVTAE